MVHPASVPGCPTAPWPLPTGMFSAGAAPESATPVGSRNLPSYCAARLALLPHSPVSQVYRPRRAGIWQILQLAGLPAARNNKALAQPRRIAGLRRDAVIQPRVSLLPPCACATAVAVRGCVSPNKIGPGHRTSRADQRRPNDAPGSIDRRPRGRNSHGAEQSRPVPRRRERRSDGRSHRQLRWDAARRRRRAFIKGVIASGVAVSAAGYLFRGPRHGVGACTDGRHRRAAGHAQRQRRRPARRCAAEGNPGPHHPLQARASPAPSWAATTPNAAPAR